MREALGEFQAYRTSFPTQLSASYRSSADTMKLQYREGLDDGHSRIERTRNRHTDGIGRPSKIMHQLYTAENP